MIETMFRFYGNLNDFLPRHLSGKTRYRNFLVSTSVKDAIESSGIPHTEIALVLVNHQSVGFDYLLQQNDYVSVYPQFRKLDMHTTSLVKPPPLPVKRFVLDCHLGKLAIYLRLLGFDALYKNDFDDIELALISNREHRILLTRDTNLLKRNIVQYGYYVRSTSPPLQIKEVVLRYDLKTKMSPFQRCLSCNGFLVPVEKQQIVETLLPKTIQYYEQFWQCQDCKKVYWKGSHYYKMLELIETLISGKG